jgi:hypothetical protein
VRESAKSSVPPKSETIATAESLCPRSCSDRVTERKSGHLFGSNPGVEKRGPCRLPFERSMIQERVRAGLARAKAAGKKFSRPSSTVPSRPGFVRLSKRAMRACARLRSSSVSGRARCSGSRTKCDGEISRSRRKRPREPEAVISVTLYRSVIMRKCGAKDSWTVDPGTAPGPLGRS